MAIKVSVFLITFKYLMKDSIANESQDEKMKLVRWKGKTWFVVTCVHLIADFIF